jgi:hypothetical protein
MKAFGTLQKRIALLTSLKFDSLDQPTTHQHLKLIGTEE